MIKISQLLTSRKQNDNDHEHKRRTICHKHLKGEFREYKKIFWRNPIGGRQPKSSLETIDEEEEHLKWSTKKKK